MTDIIHRDRNGCLLHGALKVLDAIEGVVPIVHATASCSLNARHGSADHAGSTGERFRSIAETSSVNIHDKHVVFGGTARLREQIKNSVKVLQGDLYVVATGCVPEVVGDDVPAMVKEAREQRFPVLAVSTPGFKGSAYAGYTLAVTTLLEGVGDIFGAEQTVDPSLVNILGVVPDQDPFWEGDLLEIESLLNQVGLRTNRLFGVGQGIENWKAAFRARLNIVVSPWGLEVARFLQKKNGSPYLDFGWIPTGAKDVELLLDRIHAHIELNDEALETTLITARKHSRYFRQKLARAWLTRDLAREVVVVAPASRAVGLARYLAGSFGQQVLGVVITDEPPTTSRIALMEAINEEAPDAEILFAKSEIDITGLISRLRPDMILGSAYERTHANNDTAFIEISLPTRAILPLVRSYCGIRGEFELMEDLYRVIADKARPTSAAAYNQQGLVLNAFQASRTDEHHPRYA